MDRYISVRVKSVKEISPKAVLLTAFDGSEDIFPKSVIYGYDNEVEKSDALWIAAWILPKKNLQYSPKKMRFFGGGESVEVTRHRAERKKPVTSNEIANLERSK